VLFNLSISNFKFPPLKKSSFSHLRDRHKTSLEIVCSTIIMGRSDNKTLLFSMSKSPLWLSELIIFYRHQLRWWCLHIKYWLQSQQSPPFSPGECLNRKRRANPKVKNLVFRWRIKIGRIVRHYDFFLNWRFCGFFIVRNSIFSMFLFSYIGSWIEVFWISSLIFPSSLLFA
jgi:hypothetical protein